MRHIEVSKSHSKWRAHANTVDLCVESTISRFKGASSGACFQELAQDVLRKGQRKDFWISVDTVAYNVDSFANWNIGEKGFNVQ